jgi:hypothetical protein
LPITLTLVNKLRNWKTKLKATSLQSPDNHNTSNWYQSCHDNSRLMLLLSFDTCTCSSRQHSAAAAGASRIFYVLVFCANFLQFRPKLTIQLVVEKVLSWAWSATCFDLIELTVSRHLFSTSCLSLWYSRIGKLTYFVSNKHDNQN